MRVPSQSDFGALIVFEGPDGVGKTTISRAAYASLRAGGFPCVLMSYPGREEGTLGRLVYDIHHAPASFGIIELTQASKQALHIAAHLDAIEHRILPILHAGTNGLLDRFWRSTWVYDAVLGIDRNVLRRLVDVEIAQWRDVQPSLAILLVRSSPLGRVGIDEHEWRTLVDEYAALSAQERARFSVEAVRNDGPLADAIECVTAIVRSRLAPADGPSP